MYIIKKYSSPIIKGEQQFILFQEHFKIRNMLHLKLICDMSVQIRAYMDRAVNYQLDERLYNHIAFNALNREVCLVQHTLIIYILTIVNTKKQYKHIAFFHRRRDDRVYPKICVNL